MRNSVKTMWQRLLDDKTQAKPRSLSAYEAHYKTTVTVSSIKHHGHKRFEIDVPGKDSYRHHHAGSLATGVLSPDQFALVEAKSFDDAQEAVALLPASNLILIEGFRASGFPTVELLRANNPADNVYADTFISCCKQENKAAFPCAVITDIDSVATAALSINPSCLQTRCN